MSSRISILIVKYIKQELTDDERIELEKFQEESDENRALVQILSDPDYLSEALLRSADVDMNAVWRRIKGDKTPSYPRVLWNRVVAEITKYSGRQLAVRVLRLRYAAAGIVAVVMVVIIIGLFYRFSSKRKGDAILAIDAGSVSLEYFNALLKKSNGSVFNLRDFENGTLMLTTQLMKTDRQLIYPVSIFMPQPETDTVETWTKSLYSIRLSDGSTVWLNCSSSIFYPSSFSAEERVVHLNGEAYFDIAKDVSRPFKVMAPGMEILVTGTKFNVKAYEKEGVVRTTLLEGSVTIKAQDKVTSLNAGEQAVLNRGGQLKKKKAGKGKKTTLAWTKNQFDWQNEPLETIIADICHWYGLKPVFDGPRYTMPLSATLNRAKPVNEVLGILEASAPIKLTREGSNLIIGRP